MKTFLRLWPLHLAVLVVAVVSQFIGVQSVPLGFGTILLLPMLYAFVLCLLLNPHVIPAVKKLVSDRRAAAAAPLIVIAIMPFIAKFGTTIGRRSTTSSTPVPPCCCRSWATWPPSCWLSRWRYGC